VSRARNINSGVVSVCIFEPRRSSTFRNYTHSEPRFCALLTEGASEVELALT
jgi:hypothetical protein